ncbi:MAG: c-type cytochrome [Sulfuriferula sp.]
MKQPTKLLSYAALAIASTLPLTVSAQPPVGRALAANCFQCHGTDGHAKDGMPSLAGENIYGDTIEYKRKNDLNDVMVRQAKGYTDAQIADIAKYFASIPK